MDVLFKLTELVKILLTLIYGIPKTPLSQVYRGKSGISQYESF